MRRGVRLRSTLVLLALIAAGCATPASGDGSALTAEERAVMAPIEGLFAGIEAADAGAIRAQLRVDGGGGATIVGTRLDGSRIMRHLTWEENLSYVQPSEHRNREAFVGAPLIRIDGDIAMVWGEFIFSTDGVVTHCGVDHFDLVREGGVWKIQNLTWSQRTTDCPSG